MGEGVNISKNSAGVVYVWSLARVQLAPSIGPAGAASAPVPAAADVAHHGDGVGVEELLVLCVLPVEGVALRGQLRRNNSVL